MEQLIQLLVYTHALSGFTALLAGGIAMAAPKGRKTHRLAGRFYFWGMTGVFITATAISIYKNLPFLFMIGFFSYHMVCSGYRALYLKKLHLAQKPQFIDWTIAGLAGVFSIALFSWGIYTKINSNHFVGILAIVFGLIGMQAVYRDLRRFFIAPTDKIHWLQSHISGMVGAYIATWTAFLVVNINFLPPLLTWLTPTAIGVPLILYYMRKLKKPDSQLTSEV